MRTFIAVEVPEGFADEAAGVARRLSEQMGGRFLKRRSYHLTLAVIGEADGEVVAAASEALEAACADAAPVLLRSDGLGKFGRPHDATLWMGIAPTPALTELAERVRGELAARGVPFDGKPFKPHLTLARRVRIPRGELPALSFPQPARARTVTLFKSTLERDGAVYKPLYSVELPDGE